MLSQIFQPQAQGSMNTSGFYDPREMPKKVGDRNGETQKSAYDFFTHLLGLNQQQLGYGMSLEPARQQQLSHLLSMLGPQGLQQMANEFQANQMGQATTSGLNMAAQLRGTGASESAARGAMLGAHNAGVSNSNQYAQGLQGIQGQMQMGNQMQGLFQNAQNPDLGNLNSMAALTYGKPAPVPKGPSWLQQTLGTVAGVAGMATGAGMDLGQIFSGGGGGAAAKPSYGNPGGYP